MPDFAPHDLTSNTSHPPFVVTGTPSSFGEYQAFKLVGGFSWQVPVGSFPAYVQLDLGAGNTKKLFTYVIEGSNDLDKAPKSWTVRGSTDNFVSSDDLLDTVTGQIGWGTFEFRAFGCDTVGTAYRYFKFIFTENNGNANYLGLYQIYLYDSAADTFINQLALKVIFSYDPDTNPGNASHGIADIFLGDATHTPGSVVEPGEGDIYSDGTQIAKHTASFVLPLDGTGVVPATFDNPSSADPTGAVTWFSILGSVFTTGAVDSLKVYAIYFQLNLSDGSKKWSFPSAQTIESASGDAAGKVTNPENSIDFSTDSYAEINRVAFSGLAIPTYLRVSGFSAFAPSAALTCGSPPNGSTGESYSHQIPIPTTFFSPFNFSVATPPPNLSINAAGGLLSGVLTTAGTFSFTVSLLDAIGQLGLVVCSITVVESFPVTVPSCVFEFYGLERPESVEVLPVPKKFDQVQARFDKIGKVFGFRARLIQNGSTTQMPYAVYSDDSQTANPRNSNPLYTGSFAVVPGRDNVYEIQFPKNVNTDILRLTLGPTVDSFHRYEVLLKVQSSGMESESKWIPVR